MDPILDELLRTSTLMSRQKSFKGLATVVVEQSQDVSRSDVAAFYTAPEGSNKWLRFFQRGKYTVPGSLETESELLQFLMECPEAVVLEERCESPFSDLFLDPAMKSGIALPLVTANRTLGVLILNSQKPEFYNHSRFSFLTSLARMASGLLDNAKLLRELQNYVKKVEDLERYQENIFSSMTNLLITTDEKGYLRYFNQRAKESFGLSEENEGSPFSRLFEKNLGKDMIRQIEKAGKTGEELLGLQGIFRSPQGDMDFGLNVSPLQGKRGRREGLTLLFSDQTRERELQQKMETVTEERRAIKNMFSRYLSREVVQNLMEAPELVKPGGDEKLATVFFADIRGYTSFSEGKEPREIIDILNEYFSEAVEVVIKHGGYIDKFIGDCIMAAWGVPIVAEEEDANKAVACAVEIQSIVASQKRLFFRGDAKHLKIGIGMHTGPLVAGNLGSSRRMDYSMIGDTVNIAARLEGVAGPDEIIITEYTRRMLRDNFILEKREPVRLKGKAQPVPIYNVKGMK